MSIKEELLGADHHLYAIPNQIEEIDKKTLSRAKGKSSEYESKFCTQQGEVIDVLIKANPFFKENEAGKLDIEQIDFNLRNLMDESLELSYMIQEDVPSLLIGDPGRIRQIINNLVGNAIKFTEKGNIHFRWRTVDVNLKPLY